MCVCTVLSGCHNTLAQISFPVSADSLIINGLHIATLNPKFPDSILHELSAMKELIIPLFLKGSLDSSLLDIQEKQILVSQSAFWLTLLSIFCLFVF